MEAFTVCYAENAEQLAKQMARFEGRCNVLLQEYYTGEGHGVELLLDEGRPLAMFQHKRLREIPIHGGASALRESVDARQRHGGLCHAADGRFALDRAGHGGI